MNDDSNTEISKIENQREIQKYLKETCGIEVFINEMSSVELENQGYRKLDLEELNRVSPIFQFVPQLVVDKVNKIATEQAFKKAMENSYKCLLDPSMHLATIKETSDVFLGTGLDNVSNQVKGQARWLKSKEILSISNAPQVALNAFNALSFVTGQYFMAQINSNLSEINDGIDGIKQYLDTVKESELKTSFEEFNEIIKHLRFIENDHERTKSTVNKLEGIQTVARNSINIYKKQIENLTYTASNTDDKKKVTYRIGEIRKHLVQYRYAVNVFNFSKTVNIYLNDIIDVEELKMFRNEICGTANQYKEVFERTTAWEKKYLDDNNSLNKASRGQIISSIGAGLAVMVLGNNINMIGTARKATSGLLNLFDDDRKKKKTAFVNGYDLYLLKMRNMELIDSSVTAMDRYIESTSQKVEFVSVNGECYIKYLADEQ